MAAEDRRAPETSRRGWSSLPRPVRALVWLLIPLAALEIYRQADFVVVRVFGVVLLFVFGAITALLLTPIVDRMERVPPFRASRAAAALTLYAAFFGAVAGVIALVIPHLVAQAAQLPALFKQVEDFLNGHGIHVSLPSAPSGPPGFAEFGSAVGIFTGIVTVVVDLVLVIVISIYLLIEGRELIGSMRLLLPQRQQRGFDFATAAVGATFAAYIRGQLLMSTVMGVYTAAVMSVIGVRYAVVLGVAAFLLEALPLIGAPTVMAAAVIVALFQSPVLALWAAVAGVLGHIIESYVLIPRVMGRVVRIHPLAAMAALLIGAELGGILGALFAVPLAAVGNIVLGAMYRRQRGEEAFSTARGGEVTPDNLPRLGEEIARADDAAASAESERARV